MSIVAESCHLETILPSPGVYITICVDDIDSLSANFECGICISFVEAYLEVEQVSHILTH